MTRTDEELERAAEAAIDFDPETAHAVDVRGLREISEATEAIRAYEAKQREAVALARAHGVSWNLIAGALGVSRQAARQRYSTTATAPRPKPLSATRMVRKAATGSRGTAKAATVGRAAGKAAAARGAAKAMNKSKRAR